MGNFITLQTVNELSVWAYLGFRNEYWSSVMHIMENYLNGNTTLTEAKKTFRRSLRYAYTQSAKEAWVDGGGKLPLSQEAKDYVRQYTQEQLSYMDDMFAKMRELKKSGQFIDIPKLSMEKADLWSRSVDIAYNAIKLLNAGNIMLQFTGDSGLESCTDCTKLHGKWHRAKWYIRNNKVPGSRSLECRGFRCMHYLQDRQGKIYTL